MQYSCCLNPTIIPTKLPLCNLLESMLYSYVTWVRVIFLICMYESKGTQHLRASTGKSWLPMLRMLCKTNYHGKIIVTTTHEVITTNCYCVEYDEHYHLSFTYCIVSSLWYLNSVNFTDMYRFMKFIISDQNLES